MQLQNNIILIGFMGSGKSSVGRFVAQRLGFQFLDTDALIVEREGLEISQIFALHGEAYFRDSETRTLESLASYSRCVISTGGGIVLREENRVILRELGLVVLLTAREEVIFERVNRTRKRPLLRTENPRETVARLLAERQPIYESTAQCVIDTSDLSRDEVSEAVIAAARGAFGW